MTTKGLVSMLVALAGAASAFPGTACAVLTTPEAITIEDSAPIAPASTFANIPEAIAAFDRQTAESQSVERSLGRRATAGAGMPDDPETIFANAEPTLDTATRMGQAIEAWNRWLTSWGAERAVLYAVPGEADMAMGRRGARAIAWLSDRASGIISKVVEEHDRAAAAGEATQSLDERSIATAIHLREVQIPLRAGRALILMSTLTGNAELRGQFAELAQRQVVNVQGPSAWASAQRDVVMGLAWLMRGETDDAIASFAAAEGVMREPGMPTGLIADMGDEVALGGVVATLRAKGPGAARQLLETMQDRPPFVMNGERDPHLALLACGTLMRIARAEAAQRPDASHRLVSIESAYQEYARLAERTDTGLSPAEARRLTYAGLGPLVPADAPLAVLPPVVPIARARYLAEQGQGADAMAILDPLLRRTSVELGAAEPDAMWLAAAILIDVDTAVDRRRAADLFLRLGQEFPDDPQAGQAIEAACSSAFRLFEQTNTNDVTARQRAREYLIDCLRLAHNSGANVPRRDSWRLELCRQVTAEPDTSNVRRALARMDEASQAAGAMAPDGIDRAIAGYVIASGWSTLLEQATRRPEVFAEAGMSTHDLAESLLESASGARPLIAAALRTKDGSEDQSLRQAQRATTALAAEALLATDQPEEALATVQSLSDATPAMETNPRMARVAAHALTRMGGMSEAKAWLERLCDLSPDWARWTLAEMSDRAWNQIEPMVLGFPADDTIDTARESAIPVLRLVEEQAHCKTMEESDTYKRRLAWALVVSGDGDEAVLIFEDLIARHGRQVDLLRGMGEAKLSLGKDAQAFPVFREIAGSQEEGGKHDRNYWHAWTRMIQILARQNTDGSRTDTIVRETNRLRTLDNAATNGEYLSKIQSISAVYDE